MREVQGCVQAASRAADVAQAILIKKKKTKLGPRPPLVKALRRAVKDNKGSLRHVYMTRAVQSLVTYILDEDMTADALGLGFVKGQLFELAQRLKRLNDHNFNVFLPLFTAIIRSDSTV